MNGRIEEWMKLCRIYCSSIRQLVNSSILLLFLTACGFQPLQSKAYHDKLSVDLSAVAITVTGGSSSAINANGNSAAVARRYGELLQAEIEDQTNPDATRSEKQFRLNITYSENNIALFVNPDGTASRGDLAYTSQYQIIRLRDGKPVADGTLQRTSSYNSSPTADYASYVSIEDARKRAIMELAQDYKFRLAALLPTLNDPNASALEPKPKKSIPILQPVRGYETNPTR